MSISTFLVVFPNSIFDNFYSSIYDDIITDTVKDEYQVGEIINSTNPTNSSFILDIGSGTGDIVSIFNQKNIKAYFLLFLYTFELIRHVRTC